MSKLGAKRYGPVAQMDSVHLDLLSEPAELGQFLRVLELKGKPAPTHNRLSSQIACVNVLMPLRDDPAALTALLRSIDQEVEEAVEIADRHVSTPSPVEFEWVGARGCRSLEGQPATRGQRVTSADAFMIDRLRNGRLRGYLMEWKYVEDGSEKDKNPGLRGEERRRRYEPLFKKVFEQSCQLEDFLFEPVYQLMRLCLLACKVVDDGQLAKVDSVRTVLVCPRSNKSYRTTRARGRIRQRLSAAATVEAIRSNLRDPDGLIDCSPDELVRAIRLAEGSSADRTEWLTYMQARYGW